MKTALRILAAAVALIAAIWWLAAGADRGWSKTQIPKTVTDGLTGIVTLTYEDRFVPGVDFLALALAGSGILAGISFLLPKKSAGA